MYFQILDLGDAPFILRIKFVRDRSRELLGLPQRSCQIKFLSYSTCKLVLLGEAPILKGDHYFVSQNLKPDIKEDLMKDICMYKYLLVLIVPMQLVT